MLFAEDEVLMPSNIEVDLSKVHYEDEDNDGNMSLDAAVFRHVTKIYTMTNFNKRQTAKILGVSRSTLDRKLGEHTEE